MTMRSRSWSWVLGALVLASPAVAGAQGPGATPNLECLIYPEATVALAPPVEGVLDKVLVDRGDLVQAGQVVATLEASVERATLRHARARSEREAALRSSQARVEFGDRRYLRTLEMYRKELIPLKEMDEAETAKVLAEFERLEAQEENRLAKLELERAQAILDLRTIRSPLSGVVVERLLNGGEFTKQTPIVRLAQIDPLRVEVIVPVALFGRVRVGMTADVMPEAPVGGVWPATVTVVDRVIDAASGTFGVRLALPNPDYRLPAGLKCKVRFNTPSGDRR
jgi:RND family efflux transporter MFP subunit